MKICRTHSQLVSEALAQNELSGRDCQGGMPQKAAKILAARSRIPQLFSK